MLYSLCLFDNGILLSSNIPEPIQPSGEPSGPGNPFSGPNVGNGTSGGPPGNGGGGGNYGAAVGSPSSNDSDSEKSYDPYMPTRENSREPHSDYLKPSNDPLVTKAQDQLNKIVDDELDAKGKRPVASYRDNRRLAQELQLSQDQIKEAGMRFKHHLEKFHGGATRLGNLR